MQISLTVSAQGLTIIKSFEGFLAQPYKCPAGVLTQGYGHTAAAGLPALGGIWTKSYASSVLEKTIEERYVAPLRALLTREPTQTQFDALVSLAYNIGVSAFSHSTLLKCFNQGDDAGRKVSLIEKDLTDFKIEVERRFVTDEMLARFEERLVDAINRLSDRLDRVLEIRQEK